MYGREVDWGSCCGDGCGRTGCSRRPLTLTSEGGLRELRDCWLTGLERGGIMGASIVEVEVD